MSFRGTDIKTGRQSKIINQKFSITLAVGGEVAQGDMSLRRGPERVSKILIGNFLLLLARRRVRDGLW